MGKSWGGFVRQKAPHLLAGTGLITTLIVAQ
jgi:hypothetical protein